MQLVQLLHLLEGKCREELRVLDLLGLVQKVLIVPIYKVQNPAHAGQALAQVR